MKKRVLIISIFVAFVCIFTFPAILHLHNKVIGDGVDSSLLMGWQYVAQTQIQKSVFPFSWTNYWRYPVGFNFANSYDSIIFILLGLFFYIFSNNSALVYNLSILLLLLANGILSFLFFRKISKSSLLGILGSIIYAYSFYVLARLGGHINLIFTGVFPFFVYSLIRLKENKGKGFSFLLVLISTVLIYLSSLQYLLIFLGSAIFILPLYILFFPKSALSYWHLIKNNKVKIIILLIIALCVFIFFNAGHLLAFFNGSLRTFSIHYMSYLSPRLANFFLPNSYVPLFINHIHIPTTNYNNIEGSFYFGLVEILLFVYFLFSKVGGKMKLFLLFSTITIFIISLGCGSNFLPYCSLYKFLPFRGVAEVGRFYVILYLIFTTGIILALKNSPKKFLSYLIPLIFILVIFERLPSNFYLSDLPINEPFIKVVRDLDSRAVLDLPVISQWEGSRQKSDYDLYSIYYQKPIVNGYIHWLGETADSEAFLTKLYKLKCGTLNTIKQYEIENNILPSLTSNGIKTIVFHKVLQPLDDGPQKCDLAFSNINIFLYESGLPIIKVYEDKSVAVFQLQ